jgi:putative acetyltransferase
MITVIRTDSDNADFQELVKALDADLRIRDGDEHSFFAQFNKIDSIKNVVVGYDEGKAIGCGAFKEYADQTMEVKRMFVLPEYRGRGIASLILQELEKWCVELNTKTCVLETGTKQPEAIQLYTKNNYHLIPNYGQYVGVASSVCFEKHLSS